MPVRAVIFDFNGTLSDDEALLYRLFSELFAEHGRPLTAERYFDELVGLSDPEIVRVWLGPDHPAAGRVLAERSARYRIAAGDGSTVSPAIREAVRYTAGRVPVAIVSGAARDEIDAVLQGAGLAELFSVVVAAEDVPAGKPDPAGYERALELLGGGIETGDVLVLEDTDAGIAAAQAAGMRCVAVEGTLLRERLAAADEIVPTLDAALLRRLL